MKQLYHCLSGGYERPIVDMTAEGLEGWDVELTLEDNDSGQLDLTIGEDNPEFETLCTLKSEIAVVEDDRELWRGRITSQELVKHWQKKLVCKGLMDYLYDEVISPQVFSGSAEDVLKTILGQFSASVEKTKQFMPGIVSGIEDIEYELKKPMKCFKLLSELIKEYGGSLKARRDGETNLLDWRAEDRIHRPTCSQEAVYGQNISRLNISHDADGLATVLYVYGKNNLTIESVNEGLKYIEDADAVAQFGRIVDVVTFSDVTDAAELLSRGKADLKDRLSKVRSIDAAAIDLSAVDPTVEPFEEGSYVRLYSPAHELDEFVLIKKIHHPLFKPSKMQITLGATLPAASTIMRRNL